MFKRPAERLQELHERSRALRELEAVEPLVARRGPPAHHVAYVALRHLVVGEVESRVAALAERRRDREPVLARGGPQAHEDVRLVARREPVVELRHHARPDRACRTRGRPRAARGSSRRGAPRAPRRARRARRRSAAGRSSCWRRTGSRRAARRARSGCLAQRLSPATASAPDGSITVRVSSNTSLIAAQISSFVTRTTSSTYRAHDLEGGARRPRAPRRRPRRSRRARARRACRPSSERPSRRPRRARRRPP